MEPMTAELMAWCNDEAQWRPGYTDNDRTRMRAIAARLSALDKVAKAAKELSGGLGGIAGEQDYVAPYRQVDALDAALKEAGYGE